MQELRWYLESFLDYPFPPETGHAANVINALNAWGRGALETFLQSDRNVNAGAAGKDDTLTLQIASDTPAVLSWPWEALCYVGGDAIESTCQIQRRLISMIDPMPVSADLPHDRLHILLVVARPFGLQDIGYRSIARSLVELVHRHGPSARVDVLRPPTVDQLRRHLGAHPNYYHILHFDGHGSYSRSPVFPMGGQAGHLVFERTDGGPDPISAHSLSEILRGSGLPGVVLNACQSATIGPEADTVFASVAAALLGAGIRAVVAMSYSLYVSGAQEFLPAFYSRLFDSGTMAEAVRAGRHKMRAQPLRLSARGRFELQDWLLPVLYQAEQLDFSFARRASSTITNRDSQPAEATSSEEGVFSFVGRDGSVLLLERALHRATPAILVGGLAGVGKTTLVRGFLRWLKDTSGFTNARLWFDFREIRSAEYLLNQMGEHFFGDTIRTIPVDPKIRDLAAVLGKNGSIVVWDNFESASGIAGTSATANLSEQDRTVLLRFLGLLRGGSAKILIASRSDEGWMGADCCSVIPLGGLTGEERWEYCELVLRQFGLTTNRDDPELVLLIQELGGHPLTMRVILPQLKDHTAGQIRRALKTNLLNLRLGAGDGDAQLLATLRFIEHGLPVNLRRLLVPLALCQSFLDPISVGWMTERVLPDCSSAEINDLLRILTAAGLLRNVGPAFEIHPAFSGYLKSLVTGSPFTDNYDTWCRAFADVMSRIADRFRSSAIPERRMIFHLHGNNFYASLKEAQRLGMTIACEALLNSLALWSMSNRSLTEAERLYRLLASYPGMVGQAYHQLGIIAEARGDASGAEAWYSKSLEVENEKGNQRGLAATYHQLGRLAQSKRDFAQAEDWYMRSLRLKNHSEDNSGTGNTYRQLGVLALERSDYKAAEAWHRKSFDILSRLKDERGLATLYHDMGRLAQETHDVSRARLCFRKAIELKLKFGDEHAAASSHMQLGRVAFDTGDLALAYASYLNAVNIWEKFGDEPTAANGYHSLGLVATESGDLVAAQQWFLKSLAIDERIGNEPGAAITCHGLGRLAQERKDFSAAEEWYHKSLVIKDKSANEHGKAITYSQLGLLESERGQRAKAGQWLVSALRIFRGNDPQSEDIATRAFLLAHYQATPDERTQMERLWSSARLGPFPQYRISGEERSTLMGSITQLDDTTAERLLVAIARDNASGLEEELHYTPELRVALAEFFGVARVRPSTTPGELARQALQLLGDDPRWSPAIESALAGAPADYKHKFDGGAGIALTAAVVFALRTEIEITRDKSGKWTFKLKSRAVGDSLLKPLVEKLISYLPH